MDDKKITPQELKAVLAKDFDLLAEKVADAINNATPGNIINESEEPVRDANAEFRQRLYQAGMDLLHDKRVQEDFSPSQGSAEREVEE